MKRTVASFAFSNILKGMIVLLISTTALSTAAIAQTWSAEQKEVWKAVDTIWKKWPNGDWSSVSETFVGWNTQWHSTYTQDDIKPWNKRFNKKNDVILYNLNPLAIEIHGDIAIAFYTYRLLLEDEDGKETTEEGRWVDTYKKENGKWMLIAESGHVTSSK